MKSYANAAAFLREEAPERPVLALRPHAAVRAAQWMLQHFPGEVLYAVKANDAPMIRDAFHGAGIRAFDVASLPEIEAFAPLPGVRLYLMHPVKSRELIARAYHDFGVRDFVLDSEAELAKIIEETGRPADLNLHVRLAVPNEQSLMPLDRKFGATPADAAQLLRLARGVATELGISFHVGSQALTPASYPRALAIAASVIAEVEIPVESIDVGGGFPARYLNADPPNLSAFMASIAEARDQLGLGGYRFLSEPGRALVAEAESLVVKVLGRRGDSLYINDGIYGCLFEGSAGDGALSYPVRAFRGGEPLAGSDQPFTFWGITCDSIDFLPGPFALPADIAEGDYIEIGQVGAYGRVAAGHFNGYGYYDEVVLQDAPMMGMYGAPQAPARAAASS
ncbi:type III PLP-dependent enzyme [Methyloligella sp. 2.7D]|uniref:type III PLP-dependent enzyme n=1 Tax=unclassified Methyloligella TaxID=2625955 RepID=UPI00157C6EDE|nr:type III PLP-dependent enzyme [Methyloligella sp. GL2]QKP77176.1 type III PLP-dependent enzyme [Methyloligella sp. GL2]